MNEESRRQLRRANVVARGYILAAKCSKTREEASEALCKALLIYGVWVANTATQLLP